MDGEDPNERRRRNARERKARWRARQTQESINQIRRMDAEAHRVRRQQMTIEEYEAQREADSQRYRRRRENESAEESEARRQAAAQRQRIQRQNESAEESEARREQAAQRQRIRRENETVEESQHRQLLDAEAHHLSRDHHSQVISHESMFAAHEEIEPHNCGRMNIICNFCNSYNFIGERPPDGKFNTCCRKGKLKLDRPRDAGGHVLQYPHFLQDLMVNPDNVHYKNFRDNIRSYNSALSFASMGAKLVDFRGTGPYVFKVHGQICHRTSHIQPVNGEAPQYCQLYVLDSTQATEVRVNHAANENCIPHSLNDELVHTAT